MNRRQLLSLSALSVPFVLLGCQTGTQSGGGVTFDQAKAYVNDLSLAVIAAAKVYAADPMSPQSDNVRKIAADLEAANQSFQAITDVANARSIAISVIQFVQQLSPIIAPFLGPAGAVLPLALAVVQAFVLGLPVPPQAPPRPPAALRARAAYPPFENRR